MEYEKSAGESTIKQWNIMKTHGRLKKNWVLGKRIANGNKCAKMIFFLQEGKM